MLGIRRRDFITLVGGAAAWPIAAVGQQAAMPVVGFLEASSPATSAIRLQAFRQGLTDAGFVEGKNVAIEYRFAEDRADRLPALAADIVQRRVSAISTGGSAATLAAKTATTTIPIVFSLGADPVQLGLVTSLARPGGNLTGFTNLGVEIGAKRLELMHQLLPATNVMGVLVNPTRLNAATEARNMETAARRLGIQVHLLHASSERDFNAVFTDLRRLQASALVIGGDAFFNTRREQLAAMTVRNAVPAIYQNRAFTAAGGLIAYGARVNSDSYRDNGIYVGRILKGEKPAELPVQQSTKVELIINLKTAKALGITFPLTLLGRADEVLE